MFYALFYMALPNLGPNPANARTVERLYFKIPPNCICATFLVPHEEPIFS